MHYLISFNSQFFYGALDHEINNDLFFFQSKIFLLFESKFMCTKSKHRSIKLKLVINQTETDNRELLILSGVSLFIFNHNYLSVIISNEGLIFLER